MRLEGDIVGIRGEGKKEESEREEWRGVCDGWDCALPEAFDFDPLRSTFWAIFFLFYIRSKLIRNKAELFSIRICLFDSFNLVYLKHCVDDLWGA